MKWNASYYRNSLQSRYAGSAIKSLYGQAAEVLLHMGEGADNDALLANIEVIFGDILLTESLLESSNCY